MTSIHGTIPYTFLWNVDIASVKLAGYMGRPVAAGATGASGSRTTQNEEMAALLEDICRRCEGLLTGVSERGWQDLLYWCHSYVWFGVAWWGLGWRGKIPNGNSQG